MATTGPIELKLSFGYVQAPWWGLLTYVGAALLQLGVPEAIVFKLIVPLSGLAWTRVGDGRRRFIILWPR